MGLVAVIEMQGLCSYLSVSLRGGRVQYMKAKGQLSVSRWKQDKLQIKLIGFESWLE